MIITVRNVGDKDVPLVGVTLTSGGGVSSAGNGTQGSGSEAFGYRTAQPGVADSLRPIWVIDRGPNQVQVEGPGGGVTVYAGTWTLGKLAPRQEKTFTWDVVPARSGNYRIDWRVEAGLNGKAQAKLSDGSIPRGAFPVSISAAPDQQRVTDSGEIVPAPTSTTQ
jgi:hypothetical protein